MVTNQSGVARGIVTLENLDEIHRRMTVEFGRHGLTFEGIYHAPYSVESNHPMRKPNPGMLEAAACEHGIDLSQSWIVGDRMTDVEAGHRAGCRSVLLEGVETPADSSYQAPHAFVSDIRAAARAILEATASEQTSA
jgi:histidinol-phosphate phosphatase family protein